jgi:Protein of unknown function (DUF4038)/Putative collagen-binding domain of a collagenase
MSGLLGRRQQRLASATSRVAVLGLLAFGSLACGSSKSGEPSYSISPGPTSVAPGATKQFAVTTEEPVTWGVSESGPRPGAAGDRPVFPLEVSANGRYLVDQRTRPWRVQADAAWLMSSEASPEEVDTYLATRRAQGFNAFYLSAMVHPDGYRAAPDAPNDARGNPPHATAGDFSTAGASPESERYWEWIDSIIRKAAELDMVVMLSYTYLGWSGGDMGWYEEVQAQPNVQSLVDWGAWLGNRYKDDANIIWFGLGDFTPPAGSEGSRRVNAIAEGIKAAGATQLFMAESGPPDSLPSETDFGEIVDMNSFYGYGPEGRGTVYETADRAWRTSPVMPAWMEEGTYEYENNWGQFSGDPWDTRRGRFWSVLAGGTAGDGFGSRDVWQWKDLPESLQTPGAEYSTHAFDLFQSMPWWELVPSGVEPGYAGVELITSGQGTWGELDYITAAVTEQGDWLLAYVPVTEQGPRPFEVELSALAGPVRARWFDPATGNYLAITDGYELANTGTGSFTTPGSRDDDTDDWLLVLDSTGEPRCGSITTSGVYTAPESDPGDLTCEVTATLRSEPSTIARVEVSIGQA